MQFRIDLATPDDDAAIRGLLRRQPMPGTVRVTFEREPDFSLGCRVTGEDCCVLVARAEDSGEVAGIACRSSRRLFINGQEQRLGYLGQLRVDDNFRGQWLVSRGFSLLKQMHDQDPLPGYLASIVDGNPEAVGVLVHHPRKLFPTFHEVADYCTLAISVRRAKPPVSCAARIAPTRVCDVAELVRFLRTNGAQRQFFPAWTEESIRGLTSLGLRMRDVCIAWHKDEIVGVAGLWDQSAYKQTIVRGYSGWLKAAAPFYNAGAPLFGRAALPRPGEELRSAYAAFICIANDDTGVFAALLRELYNQASLGKFDFLLIGLDARDPLLPIAREYAHVQYASRLYLAEWPEGGSLHEQLDQRPAYVDIATL